MSNETMHMTQRSNPTSSSQLAGHEMLSRICNAYLRETGQHHPQVNLPHLPGISLKVALPNTGQTLYGTLLHLSKAGHHVYGAHFYTAEIESLPPDQWTALTFSDWVTLLLNEISSVEQPHSATSQTASVGKKVELEQMISNSLEHMASYLEHASLNGAPATLDFRYIEQALLCGHPFHPTPKSLEGFSLSDSLAYSPEYGVSFPLSCFAASPELIEENWLNETDADADAIWLPAEMTEAAYRLLQPSQQSYKLLPCHPWQAEYLRSLDHVQRLLADGSLIDLGSTGPDVIPTSSVRTVWNPKDQCFYKLSLHIRITNFIRENNEEQLLRTLDASKIVEAVQQRWRSDSFDILLEKGYRTFAPLDVDSSVRDTLMSGFSMIVREAPNESDPAKSPPYVIASLMEVLPGENEPLLFRAVRQSRSVIEDETDWLEWFRQYAALSIVPVLNLYAKSGISLEAHVQNSMLSLQNGQPSAFVVRDLEGISVDRSVAEQQGWIGSRVQADSPVLYSEEEARYRLKYYFFVNHLSHVVQRLSYYSGQSEQAFWKVVRQTLESLTAPAASPSDRLYAVVQDLLTTATLPAKANLLSRFHQRGEQPLYVDIPNPILSIE